MSAFPPGECEEGGELFETHLSPMNRAESDSARPHAAQETMRLRTFEAYVWSRECFSTEFKHLLYLRCMQAPSEATNRLVTGCSPTVLGPEFHGQGGPPYMLPSLTDISAGQFERDDNWISVAVD